MFLAIVGFFAFLFLLWVWGRGGSGAEPAEPRPADGWIKRASMTDEGFEYELHPASIRCTCPDWEKRRSAAKYKDTPIRVCKHLAVYYLEHPEALPECLKEWWPVIEVRALKEWGMPSGPATYGTANDLPTVIDLKDYEYSGWINVITQGDEFGWNKRERRWSYGRGPKGKKDCLELIRLALQDAGLK